MTITIDVSPEAEGPLEHQAEQSGLAIPEYVRRIVEACVALPSEAGPVIFTTPEGEICIQSEMPADTARSVALASERTLGKIWNTPEEEAGCQALLAEM